MSKHITSKGKVIDMESVIAQQGESPAIGNMSVNGKGDLLGPGGKIIKTADQRARDHYKNDTIKKCFSHKRIPILNSRASAFAACDLRVALINHFDVK